MATKQHHGFNIDLHPRYSKSSPNGGEFMPKGGKDWKANIAQQKKVIAKKIAAKAKKVMVKHSPEMHVKAITAFDN